MPNTPEPLLRGVVSVLTIGIFALLQFTKPRKYTMMIAI